MDKIKDLLWTGPDDMLKDNKALLEEDSEKLGASTVENREYWVASMYATFLMAEHKQRWGGTTTDNEALDEHVQHPPEFDDEYSLWYRKRGQK